MKALALVAVVALSAAKAQTLNPIIDPTPYTEWIRTSSDGLSRRASVKVPFVNASGADDNVHIWQADFVGDAAQRGFAQVTWPLRRRPCRSAEHHPACCCTLDT